MIEQASDVYSYITSEISNFKLPIELLGWQWSMADHIKTGFYYKHGRLLTGNSDMKPVKNIVRPILNLQYRTEDIDVKDVMLFVDDPDRYDLSFLVKKYHDDVFTQEYDLDTLWDETNESRIDYGGGLLKDVNSPAPEFIPLSNIAFCDQTDMLSGPICIKHFYSPDQLLEMAKKGWGDENKGATITLEDLIVLSRSQKQDDNGGQINKTPGKYIEIYELHGTLPETWLTDEFDDSPKYVRQMQIIGYYQSQNGKNQGVCLYRGKEKDGNFKLVLRDKIHGRALGFGGVEELQENQVWVNYNQIKFRELIDATKTLFQTTDQTLNSKGKLEDKPNMSLLTLEEGKAISQVDTFPRNIELFKQATADWEAHAQQTGAANDSIMGKSPNSGTPFKLQELVTQESHGLHDHRRGKFAKFIEEVYKDWIIPHIAKEIVKGKKFLSELSMDEMEMIYEKISQKEVNRFIMEAGGPGAVELTDIEVFKEQLRKDFMKDNKKFIVILENELKDVSLSVKVNVAGKQKDLNIYTDKLVNIFRQIAAAPQLLDDPRMSKIFNEILESSGLSPIEFGALKTAPKPETNDLQNKQGGQEFNNLMK